MAGQQQGLAEQEIILITLSEAALGWIGSVMVTFMRGHTPPKAPCYVRFASSEPTRLCFMGRAGCTQDSRADCRSLSKDPRLLCLCRQESVVPMSWANVHESVGLVV